MTHINHDFNVGFQYIKWLKKYLISKHYKKNIYLYYFKYFQMMYKTQ